MSRKDDEEMVDVMASRYDGKAGLFTALQQDEEGEEYEEPHWRGRNSLTPAKSIEGWIVVANGIHEEAQEEDVLSLFEEFGEIRNLHLNLDRRTGYVKGYALLAFADYQSASQAIQRMDGREYLGRKLTVQWAFVKAPRT